MERKLLLWCPDSLIFSWGKDPSELQASEKTMSLSQTAKIPGSANDSQSQYELKHFLSNWTKLDQIISVMLST